MNSSTYRVVVFFFIAVFTLTTVHQASAVQQIKILVSTGSFNTVEEAASGG